MIVASIWQKKMFTSKIIMVWYKLTKQVEVQPQPKLINNPTKIIEGIKSYDMV